jgi:hypothetical protein
MKKGKLLKGMESLKRKVVDWALRQKAKASLITKSCGFKHNSQFYLVSHCTGKLPNFTTYLISFKKKGAFNNDQNQRFKAKILYL